MARVINSSPLQAREGLLKNVKMYREGLRKWYPELIGKEYNTKQSYEQIQLEGDFGMAPVVDETDGVVYDDFRTPYDLKIYVQMRSTGFQVSKQAKYTDLYGIVARPSKKLSMAMTKTKEQVVANKLVYAFSTATGYVGADGVAMCSTAHPVDAGTTANRPTVDAGFGYQAYADAIKDLGFMVSDRGDPAPVMGPFMVVGSFKNRDRMMRVVKSPMIADNANNSISSVKDITDTIHINPYLNGVQDYWFVIDKELNPISMLNRIPLHTDEDYDMDHKIHKFSIGEEYAVFHEGALGIWGTTGSGG